MNNSAKMNAVKQVLDSSLLLVDHLSDVNLHHTIVTRLISDHLDHAVNISTIVHIDCIDKQAELLDALCQLSYATKPFVESPHRSSADLLGKLALLAYALERVQYRTSKLGLFLSSRGWFSDAQPLLSSLNRFEAELYKIVDAIPYLID